MRLPSPANCRSDHPDSRPSRPSLRVLGSGELIHAAHAVLDVVYQIQSGTVSLSREVSGRRVVFGLLHPGDLVGEVPVLLGRPTTHDAFAQTDVVLRVASRSSQGPQSDAAVTAGSEREVLSRLAKRLSGLESRLAGVLDGNLGVMVASILLRESGKSVAVPLTHQTIADLLGAQRASITRVLHQLQAAGMIEVGYARIAVSDRRALSLLAGHEPGDRRTW